MDVTEKTNASTQMLTNREHIRSALPASVGSSGCIDAGTFTLAHRCWHTDAGIDSTQSRRCQHLCRHLCWHIDASIQAIAYIG